MKKFKAANPNGHFWIKLDATDIKAAIRESVKGNWMGEPDTSDGKLAAPIAEYDDWLRQVDEQDIDTSTSMFQEDIAFLARS